MCSMRLGASKNHPSLDNEERLIEGAHAVGAGLEPHEPRFIFSRMLHCYHV